MAVAISNLVINKIIVHEVFKRGEDKRIVTPSYSDYLEDLSVEGLEEITKRIIDACGRDSHCVQMEITEIDVNSVFDYASLSLSNQEENFIELSKDITFKLAQAQTSRGYPAGAVVCFTGTVSQYNYPCYGIIKTEKHAGFAKHSEHLVFLKDLLLTPSQRLYKIGLFIEVDNVSEDETHRDSCDFQAYVFDHLLRNNEAKAAHYFYNSFLGCNFMHNAKRITADFYKSTSLFIDNCIQLSDEEKLDLKSSLYVYLKLDNQNSISVTDFSTKYISDPALRDSYRNYCESEGLPSTSFNKDIFLLKSKLKRRKIKFNTDVNISAPVNKFNDLVRVLEIDENKNTTKILIKGRINKQE
ncbi:MAG: nucleoid-associated protein [Candidatus Cloacimonetes bacterium]|nr:nucleoid-associated protein [Candidatus Cloacimonadota bacterium]